MMYAKISTEQMKNIVREIVGDMVYPEYQSQIYYMLIELNIEYEICD